MLNPTAAQSLRAFPQLTTMNFDRILAAEPGMTCYRSEGPSDSAQLDFMGFAGTGERRLFAVRWGPCVIQSPVFRDREAV